MFFTGKWSFLWCQMFPAVVCVLPAVCKHHFLLFPEAWGLIISLIVWSQTSSSLLFQVKQACGEVTCELNQTKTVWKCQKQKCKLSFSCPSILLFLCLRKTAHKIVWFEQVSSGYVSCVRHYDSTNDSDKLILKHSSEQQMQI